MTFENLAGFLVMYNCNGVHTFCLRGTWYASTHTMDDRAKTFTGTGSTMHAAIDAMVHVVERLAGKS